MPSPSNFLIEQLIDGLSKKIDNLSDQFKHYVLIEEFNRQITEVKSDIKALIDRYNADVKWANEEHSTIKEKLEEENKHLREMITQQVDRLQAESKASRNVLITIGGSMFLLVLGDIIQHIVFK